MTSRLAPAAALAALALFAAPAPAKGPLVFITSFAPGEKGGIQAYRFNDATGGLSPLRRTGGVENPFFLALSPDRKHLYSIHARQFGGKEDEEVAAFEVVGREGELKFLNRQSAKGTAACYLAVDATGKAVLAANYASGSVASLPVRADGSLGPAASFFQHAGASVNTQRQKGPHAHAIIPSPDNRFALAADLGTDQVLSYRLDPATATLTANQPAFAKAPPGAGPRHLTFHPNGKVLYAVNELLNSVTVYDFDAKAGSLTARQTIPTLPADFKGVSHCADVKTTPDGRWLYVTNRGHDSIAAYRVAADGGLTLVAIEPSLGKGPQNLAVTPDGAWLLCANMPGNGVAVFRVDGSTGRLKAAGAPVAHPSPSCIMLVPE